MADNPPERKKLRPNEEEEESSSSSGSSSSSSSSSSSHSHSHSHSSLSSSAPALGTTAADTPRASTHCCMPQLPFQVARDLEEQIASRPVDAVRGMLSSMGLFKLLPQVAAWKFEGAETIYRAGHVLTVDASNSVLSPGYVAARGGDIVAVGGTEESVAPWRGTKTQFHDLGDHATLVPGLIEPHMHILGFGAFLNMEDCSFEQCSTLEKVYQKLAAAAAKTDKDFVLGWGFDSALLADHAEFDCDEMNKYVGDKRVALMHSSMHIAFLNRFFLDQLNIKEGSKPPTNGEFGRNAAGKLTGELLEVPCMMMVMHALPELDYPKIMQAGLRAAAYLQRQGVTTATDAGVGMIAKENDFHCYQDLTAEASVPLRIIGMPLYNLFPRPMFHTGFGSKWCRVGPMKFILDGSAQGFTAWLTKPYYTQPNNYGIPGMTEEQFRDGALYAHTHGFQMAIHCNGDAALDLALRTVEWLLEVHPRPDHRHRIEHCQLPRADQLLKLKELNMVANFFVAHTYFFGDWHMEKTFGPERAPHISPLATARKLGIPMTIHSDAPVTPPGPLKHMQYAVTRRSLSGKVIGPDECVDVRTALRAVTIDAAYASHCEENLGSLETGKLADMTVLAENPYEVDSDKIGSIKVLATVSAGKYFPVPDDEDTAEQAMQL